MVGEAVARLGRLDVLVNNAGTTNTRAPIEFADLGAMTREFWGKILSTNSSARSSAPRPPRPR